MKSRFGKLMHVLFRTNLPKTILFNWKMLPAKQAWRMPFYFYGKTTFRSLTGKVIIESPVRSGMIKVGRTHYVTTSKPWTIWTIRGTMIFKGAINFFMGSYVMVSDQAVLRLGKRPSGFGSNIRIFCFERIEIGDNTRFAWDCQIMDTSFHYIEKLETGELPMLTKPVFIGDRVSVFSRSSISKGAVIPNDSIIAANSMVNKDFSAEGPFCLLAGVPAVRKASGLRRIWDVSEEARQDKRTGYHRTHL